MELMWTKTLINQNWDALRIHNEGKAPARPSKIQVRDSPLVAKVLAIEEAMNLANQYGWKQAGFISESSMVIEAIKNNQNDHP